MQLQTYGFRSASAFFVYGSSAKGDRCMLRTVLRTAALSAAILMTGQLAQAQYGGVQLQFGNYGSGLRIGNYGYGNGIYNGFGYSNPVYSSRYGAYSNNGYYNGAGYNSYANNYYGYQAPRYYVTPSRSYPVRRFRYR